MGVLCMEITKNCQNCGEVVFRLIPKTGGYRTICSACGSIVGEVQLKTYETVIENRTRCDSNKFKAKVKNEIQDQSCTLECAECKSQPEYRYVDTNLKEIDEVTRENLVLKDTIIELKGKVNELEYQLFNLSYTEYTVNSNLDSIASSLTTTQE